MKRRTLLWVLALLSLWYSPAWGQPQGDELRLYLNLPTRTLVLYRGDEVTARYPVAIGKPSDPTPTGQYSIDSVIFNPNWYNGAVAGTTAQRRVPPGPNNPMGQAKINFSKNYYLHGTPHPWSVGLAVSHGCLRMENRDVLALARHLMEHNATVDYAAIEETLRATPPEPREVALTHAIPLEIDYRLLSFDHESGTIWPDIYRRFPQPLQTVQRQLEDEAERSGRTLELPASLIQALSRPVTRRIDFDITRP